MLREETKQTERETEGNPKTEKHEEIKKMHETERK